MPNTLNHTIEAILVQHKACVDCTLPCVQQLIADAAEAAESETDTLAELQPAFADLRRLVETHCETEETAVFRLILLLEEADEPSIYHCKSISRPIGVMRVEYHEILAAARRIRDICAGPAQDCPQCYALRPVLEALCGLEAELREISSCEEQLFAQAITRESALKASVKTESSLRQ